MRYVVCFKYGFISDDIYDIDSMLSAMDLNLFNKMRNRTRCINSLLPTIKSSVYALRYREHHFELPSIPHGSLVRNSSVVRCLYRYT